MVACDDTTATEGWKRGIPRHHHHQRRYHDTAGSSLRQALLRAPPSVVEKTDEAYAEAGVVANAGGRDQRSRPYFLYFLSCLSPLSPPTLSMLKC